MISGHADLLRRHGKKLLEKNEGDFENSVSLTLKESGKMTKIVQNLLELTRLENRLTKPKNQVEKPCFQSAITAKAFQKKLFRAALTAFIQATNPTKQEAESD